MRLLVLTSNAIRHKYVANRLQVIANETMVISECKAPAGALPEGIMRDHFKARDHAEYLIFHKHQTFKSDCFPIQYGALHDSETLGAVTDFSPHIVVTFGCSLIKSPLLSILPQDKVVNIHLGVAPHYRGSGTNFFPWVYNDLGNVGATLMLLDQGIDTGPILDVARAAIAPADNVHTLGCKTIMAACDKMAELLPKVYRGTIKPTPQVAPPGARLMKRADFTEDALRAYLDNLKNGIVEKHLNNTERK